jgi:hypothetical protein|tara:strand:- start:5425 stop:6489 length:1065 start_codon:yes stop_codon:yes gene_type:complete
MKKGDTENQGIIAAILAISKPTRYRTVVGEGKDITYDSHCPQELVSGSRVIICPTKKNLKDFAELDGESNDVDQRKAARAHPAYLASDAMHKLEALQNVMSRKMKSTTIETPYDRIFPESEEEEFLSDVAKFRIEFENQRDIFFTYYDDMVSYWVQTSTNKWGSQWGNLVKEHSPDLMNLATRFQFIGETRDVTLRSTELKTEEIVSFFFDDLISTVENWNKGLKDITKKNILELKRLILPKLQRYEFLDKRVKPISQLVDTTFEKAIDILKTKKSTLDALEGDDLVEFNKTLQVLTNSQSLLAIQLVSTVSVTSKPKAPVMFVDFNKTKVKPTLAEQESKQSLMDKFKASVLV